MFFLCSDWARHRHHAWVPPTMCVEIQPWRLCSSCGCIFSAPPRPVPSFLSSLLPLAGALVFSLMSPFVLLQIAFSAAKQRHRKPKSSALERPCTVSLLPAQVFHCLNHKECLGLEWDSRSLLTGTKSLSTKAAHSPWASTNMLCTFTLEGRAT